MKFQNKNQKQVKGVEGRAEVLDLRRFRKAQEDSFNLLAALERWSSWGGEGRELFAFLKNFVFEQPYN